MEAFILYGYRSWEPHYTLGVFSDEIAVLVEALKPEHRKYDFIFSEKWINNTLASDRKYYVHNGKVLCKGE